MLKIFIGYDPRQPISSAVLEHSLVQFASVPISVTTLVLPQLPIKRAGLTPFTYSRFLVPYLCDYKGWGLFLDADMLALDDIAKLFNQAKSQYHVMVVKNKMRLEWASLMLFNCEKCSMLTPEYIESAEGLLTLTWSDESLIGELPSEWNHLVGYDEPRSDARLVHYSQGIPGFPELQGCEYQKEWMTAYRALNAIGSWKDIMGKSIHATELNGKLVPKLVVDRLQRHIL